MTVRDQLITDLVTAVSKPPRKPAQAGQVRRSSATLLTWDAAELRGSVDWNGTVINDVPLLGAIDAFGWAAGDEVVLDTIPGTNGGFSSPMILGRVFRPGAANAAKVLQALQNEFAKQIAAEINAANITSATALGTETTADTNGFQELPGGPSLEVDVSATGKVIVHLATVMHGFSVNDYPTQTEHGGRMAVSLSGANTQAASNERSVAFEIGVESREIASPFAGNHTVVDSGLRSGTTFVIDGLAPGLTTFTAQYARLYPGEPIDFTDRTIVVVRS